MKSFFFGETSAIYTFAALKFEFEFEIFFVYFYQLFLFGLVLLFVLIFPWGGGTTTHYGGAERNRRLPPSTGIGRRR